MTLPFVYATQGLIQVFIYFDRGGIPGQLIPLWKSGHIKSLASAETIDEYIRMMTYPKFKLTEEEIHYLLYSEILPYFEVVSVGWAAALSNH